MPAISITCRVDLNKLMDLPKVGKQKIKLYRTCRARTGAAALPFTAEIGANTSGTL